MGAGANRDPDPLGQLVGLERTHDQPAALQRLEGPGAVADFREDEIRHARYHVEAERAQSLLQLRQPCPIVARAFLRELTVVQRRNDPKLYEIFTTGIGFNTDPSQMTILSCDWPGWTCDPKLDALQSRLACETDFARRKAVWEEIQRWFWDEVPVVKLGDFFTLRVKQKSVVGYANRYRPFFWNVGLRA